MLSNRCAINTDYLYNAGMPIPANRLLVFVVGAACAVLVACLLLEFNSAAIAAKLIASTAFVMLALRAGALRSMFGRLVLVGLLCSWCGDMFLTGSGQAAFLGGLVAFLLAHVAYVAAFAARGVSPAWLAAAALPIAGLAFAVSVWLAPYIAPALALPVRMYTAVISLMVVFAVGTRGRGATLLIPVGAILFFVSDLSVAALRLVQTDLPTYVLGLPFYYAGQVCLAVSVSDAQSRSH